MNADNAPPNGEALTAAKGLDRSKWRYLKDMTLPPEMQKVVEDTCKEWKVRKPAARREVEEDVKLQHFFGGQAVAYVTTPQGLLIVCAGDMEGEEFAVLDALPRSERCQITTYSPPRWNDGDSMIGIIEG